MYKLPLNRSSRLLWALLGTALVATGTRREFTLDAGCGIGGCTMLLWAFAAPACSRNNSSAILSISRPKIPSLPAIRLPPW